MYITNYLTNYVAFIEFGSLVYSSYDFNTIDIQGSNELLQLVV